MRGVGPLKCEIYVVLKSVRWQKMRWRVGPTSFVSISQNSRSVILPPVREIRVTMGSYPQVNKSEVCKMILKFVILQIKT